MHKRGYEVKSPACMRWRISVLSSLSVSVSILSSQREGSGGVEVGKTQTHTWDVITLKKRPSLEQGHRQDVALVVRKPPVHGPVQRAVATEVVTYSCGVRASFGGGGAKQCKKNPWNVSLKPLSYTHARIPSCAIHSFVMSRSASRSQFLLSKHDEIKNQKWIENCQPGSKENYLVY